ncbi:MAG TPA: M24 family metallopeptidase, partial [Chloroflexota bacterium]|nr:M24 family metallopeptidase [Chloroflexota bacterium]
MIDTAAPYEVNRTLADVDHSEGMYPYPRFSLAERERRWSSLRALMSQQALDAIVTPQNTGHSMDFQANTRWLTHCGGGGDADIAAVFPLEGDVTIVATTAKLRWPPVQNWVTDAREARRNYGRVIVERLKELNPKRIGIAGLGDGTRTPEGTILHGTYRQIREAFPQADLVDATELLAELRHVKSEEEIAFLARSKEFIELATDAEIAAAKPGQSDWVVWAETVHAMFRAGSEMPVHCNWISGARPQRTLTRASHRILEPGDIIMNELEASWGGYRSQGVVPVTVGRPDPVYDELMKVQGELFFDMLEALKPGTTLGELQQRCARKAQEVAPKTGLAA